MGEDNQDLLCLKGYPDLVVLSELSPYMTLLIAENKLPPKLWRGDPHDSQLGQLLFYLVAHQIKAVTILPYPKPVMGLFMADGHFCTAVAELGQGTLLGYACCTV